MTLVGWLNGCCQIIYLDEAFFLNSLVEIMLSIASTTSYKVPFPYLNLKCQYYRVLSVVSEQ